MRSSVEELTQQFYEWENWGRGWKLWPYPVQVEPPFQEFPGYALPEHDAGDDGRIPPLWERAWKWLRSVGDAPARGEQARETERRTAPCEFDGLELVELELTPPPGLKHSPTTWTRFLSSLPRTEGPLAFELFATGQRIVPRMICACDASAELTAQLRAHYPDMGINLRSDSIESFWGGDQEYRPGSVVEFGLSHEFMLPLAVDIAKDLDPLASVLAGMTVLGQNEIALLQVLFKPCRFPWAASAMEALAPGGQSFFLDAPEMHKVARSKLQNPLYAVVLRLGARARFGDREREILQTLTSGLRPLCTTFSNSLLPLEEAGHNEQIDELLLRQSRRSGMLLSGPELALLVHPPGPSIKTEKLSRQSRATRSAPETVQAHGLVLGTNEHLGRETRVSLSPSQRSRHTYVVGASGTGKSTLLLNMVLQDIEAGRGCAVLDPHGDLVDDILGRIPDHRMDDVVLMDPSDPEYAVGFNILAAHSDLERQLLSSDLVAVFRRLSTSWGDQMTSVLANAVQAFLESSEGGTLSDLRRFLVEKGYRRRFLTTVEDPEVVYFWNKEFPLLTGRPQAPLLTRLDAFLRPRLIRHMVAQKDNSLDFRKILDGQKIFLARLSQGAIGEENAHLLGALLVSKIQQTAQSRQDLTATERAPFFLYLDEFQHFITPSMAAVLSGARKYGLGLVLAHQDLSQLGRRETGVLGAAISNPATRICFRVGDMDARKLAEGFSHFDAKDLQSLSVGQAICRVDQAQHDFSLDTQQVVDVDPQQAAARRAELVDLSREKYATKRANIDYALRQIPAAEEPPGRAPTRAPKSALAETAPLPPPLTPEKPKARAPATPGRGGRQHKYLQSLIKNWGESAGYVATIEAPVPNGAGTVDVLLERAGKSVAIEISVTTPPEHELANLRKCLTAGYKQIVALNSREKPLRALEALAKAELSPPDLRRVRFLSPERLLDELGQEKQPQTSTVVKGYEIQVEHAGAGDAERRARMDAIAKALRKR